MFGETVRNESRTQWLLNLLVALARATRAQFTALWTLSELRKWIGCKMDWPQSALLAEASRAPQCTTATRSSAKMQSGHSFEQWATKPFHSWPTCPEKLLVCSQTSTTEDSSTRTTSRWYSNGELSWNCFCLSSSWNFYHWIFFRTSFTGIFLRSSPISIKKRFFLNCFTQKQLSFLDFGLLWRKSLAIA